MQILKRRSKRVAVISDLHSGHRVGMTPPAYNSSIDSNNKNRTFVTIRKQAYNWLERKLASLQPIDVLIVNGDCIDGRGRASKGTELLTSDREIQSQMARDIILLANADKIFMSYGTGYHTGKGEDWENWIAHDIDAEIDDEGFLDVNGLVFNYKHHLGSSSVPYGRATQISKARVWNNLWALQTDVPKADVLLRSHVHYHQFAGSHNWLSMSTPALQAPMSKYGGRRHDGIVHFGMVHFDVEKDGQYKWQSHITNEILSVELKRV